MIPQRTLSGICEITTGALSIMQRPPVYTGESAALNVQVAFKFQNVDYVLPETVVAEMYLRYPNTELMTVAVEMEKSGNTASGVLSAEQTGVAGYPLLVIQLTDMETSSLIVACATAVKVSDVRGDLVIDTRAPSPSEIIYIGRSPYINPSNGHWMQWDVSTNAYVDTDVVARGLPATFTAHATTLPEGSDATASIGGTALNPIINVGIPKGDTGAKGNTGSAAGFGTPTASVDDSVGTPSVQVTTSGPNTAKVFNFEFHNLKGQKGDTGGVSSVNGKTGPVQLNDEDIPSTIDGKANVEAVLSYHSENLNTLDATTRKVENVAIGETVISRNSFTFVAWLGWSRMKIVCSNPTLPFIVNSNHSYTVEVQNNNAKVYNLLNGNMENLSGKISSFNIRGDGSIVINLAQSSTLDNDILCAYYGDIIIKRAS